MKQLGLIGLGVMGRNLALNARDHGIDVLGYDLDPVSRHRFHSEGAGRTVDDPADLVNGLSVPRTILLLVPAGDAVDQQLQALMPLLSADDWVIDAGNSHFKDTNRRQHAYRTAGLEFIGMGISGGAEGARQGPAMMFGGSPLAEARLQAMLAPLAARIGRTPCFGYFGEGGAGHFVKMIHNGIEYADMQIIAEGYYLLRHAGGKSPHQIGEIFGRWNEGPLASYLMDISAQILTTGDGESGGALVDAVVDTAEQKGTGHWAVTAAMELGVSVPTIGEAVHARSLSALRDERLAAGRQPMEPTPDTVTEEDVFATLLAGKICAYAQGFAVLAAARKTYGWALEPALAAQVWQGGCILRGALLSPVQAALATSSPPANLMQDPHLSSTLAALVPGWRRAVGLALTQGLPIPASASALSYWDGYHSKRLWADLLQTQRDYFGAHGFRRLDRDGICHGPWERKP